MPKKTRYICLTAFGIAMYCALSLSMKIPLGVGHIAVDLGYIVLAAYAYHMGSISAAVVGGCAAAIMSVLSGWFSAEWVAANAFVGLTCGALYEKSRAAKSIAKNLIITVFFVGVGMLVIKTSVSCWMFSIPVAVKLPKSLTAWVIDSIVMCFGVVLAPRLPIKANK